MVWRARKELNPAEVLRAYVHLVDGAAAEHWLDVPGFTV